MLTSYCIFATNLTFFLETEQFFVKKMKDFIQKCGFLPIKYK